METDREVVERGRAGDERAFHELVERYKQLVYALVHRTVPDHTRAEDLAHEVFVRVYSGLPYFRGEARVSTWIYRIVVSTCLQEAAGRAGPGSAGAEAGDPGSRLRLPPRSGERRLSDSRWVGQLEQAIARLPVNYRLLIAGYGLEGIQFDDLGDALQLPPGTARMHVHRAKRQLRRLLDTEF
jgi:RNA polymerase sigma-70 factor (ECF subfamily)